MAGSFFGPVAGSAVGSLAGKYVGDYASRKISEKVGGPVGQILGGTVGGFLGNGSYTDIGGGLKNAFTGAVGNYAAGKVSDTIGGPLGSTLGNALGSSLQSGLSDTIDAMGPKTSGQTGGISGALSDQFATKDTTSFRTPGFNGQAAGSAGRSTPKRTQPNNALGTPRQTSSLNNASLAPKVPKSKTNPVLQGPEGPMQDPLTGRYLRVNDFKPLKQPKPKRQISTFSDATRQRVKSAQAAANKPSRVQEVWSGPKAPKAQTKEISNTPRPHVYRAQNTKHAQSMELKAPKAEPRVQEVWSGPKAHLNKPKPQPGVSAETSSANARTAGSVVKTTDFSSMKPYIDDTLATGGEQGKANTQDLLNQIEQRHPGHGEKVFKALELDKAGLQNPAQSKTDSEFDAPRQDEHGQWWDANDNRIENPNVDPNVRHVSDPTKSYDPTRGTLLNKLVKGDYSDPNQMRSEIDKVYGKGSDEAKYLNDALNQQDPKRRVQMLGERYHDLTQGPISPSEQGVLFGAEGAGVRGAKDVGPLHKGNKSRDDGLFHKKSPAKTKVEAYQNSEQYRRDLKDRKEYLKKNEVRSTPYGIYKRLPEVKDLKSAKGGRLDLRTNGLKGSEKRYYDWDPNHGGEMERYRMQGRQLIHDGVVDPVTGELIKPAKPKRKIDLVYDFHSDGQRYV
ncbi:colicin E3/pyocin S6 family cytotoxin [Magnetovibrio sp. PR-2]|uniref:colicin E3/pyocin S6 family cytotoxin n=1 Tax=Magnetovibrio sp. PR-2 TaxID=3120356 RepID=UPI002FCE48B6